MDLTAEHKGYFVFRICPHNNPLVPATQECLDLHELERADGQGTRLPVVDTGLYEALYKLPEGVTCDQCVFQWHYNTGMH